MAQVKPGFLVSAKVSKTYDNGVELTFLGGMTGTCFADHLGPEKLSIGSKVVARVISADPVSKNICLSLKQHLVKFSSFKSAQKTGETFEKVKVIKSLYGGSYLVSLPAGQQGFLHKTQ